VQRVGRRKRSRVNTRVSRSASFLPKSTFLLSTQQLRLAILDDPTFHQLFWQPSVLVFQAQGSMR
jgi:hypothetical protein